MNNKFKDKNYKKTENKTIILLYNNLILYYNYNKL